MVLALLGRWIVLSFELVVQLWTLLFFDLFSVFLWFRFFTFWGVLC